MPKNGKASKRRHKGGEELAQQHPDGITGRDGRLVHPNSLKNLRPAWEPGTSPNPAGRPSSAGASIREWMNVMHQWDEEEVRKVADSKAMPMSKRAAARYLLAMLEDTHFGRDHRGLVAGVKVMENTDGRPVQRVEVEQKRLPTPEEAESRLLAMIESNPQIAQALVSALPGFRLVRVAENEALPGA